MTDASARRRAWLYPMLALGGVALGWFLLLLLAHHALAGQREGFWALLTGYRADDVQAAIGNLPEVVVGVLGIAITVVSIIVQLSATRYTPRVTDMFFRDRTNLLVLGFLVITSIHCVWASFAIHQRFVPHLLIAVTLLMITGAILVLIPYFAYVFAFLDPERIVARLEACSLAVAVEPVAKESTALRQRRVLEGIEQLADVAVNSVSNKDRIIASRAVDALKDLVCNYLARKRELPDDWFTIGSEIRHNPDFTVMARQSLAGLNAGKAWLEFKVLRQSQTIFNECLNRMRDLGQLVAIDTRYIGEAAIERGDRRVLELAVKFFNTYMRATINARDVRTAYNVLHQYRQLAEAVLRAGWSDDAVELAGYFKYYGQTASAANLDFVTETAAYDMSALCELAHELRCPQAGALLTTFLEVDKVPETEAQERSLRGVRKAQIQLATYFLCVDAEELARRIFHDMEHERPERLLSIREELLAVRSEDFWEIIDRGRNFDFLDAPRREQLHRFFSWFPAHIRASTSS